MAAFFTKHKQLQWLALLAIAVALPTVSLLWFMSQVIANERLVVRQKLTALYQDKLADAGANTSRSLSNQLASLDGTQATTNPYSLFRQLVLKNGMQGLVIWDKEGLLVYPNTTEVFGTDASPDNPLAGAWQEEFAKQRYAEAAQLYNQHTSDEDPSVAIAALAGKSRCFSKLGKLDHAIAVCQEAAFYALPPGADAPQRHAMESARLLLLSLLKEPSQAQEYSRLYNRIVDSLINDLYSPEDTTVQPTSQNLFTAQKVLSAIRIAPYLDDPGVAIPLEQLIAAEKLSLSAAKTLQAHAGLFDGFFHTELDGTQAYGLRHQTADSTILVLLSGEGFEAILSGYHEAFAGSESTYRILNKSSAFVAGTLEPPGQPFTTAPLPSGFPDWKVELFFVGSDVFEKAAKRQIAVYTWSGFLVILLILIAGAIATRAVSRQIRLNEMKNDFIATVSHELKTPLASMRVLVDTLLDGHITDEAQVSRYLKLTAKENERLSRMIDNFLTFSRMERNKKAFSLADAVPAAIANDAAEAVQTKYTGHKCQFKLEIAEDLPEFRADHDAIVTVLVNLLDNACKYTTDNKEITLRVFGEPGLICFAVSDNGIGLSRKHVRKIFDSFYQVDSSLARKAEGCGLGLSIVNFIVSAHKGDVAVESKQCQGSTFTVRLPIGHGNGNGSELHHS